jgi:hypothetical protein
VTPDTLPADISMLVPAPRQTGQTHAAEAFRSDGATTSKRAGAIALGKGTHEPTIDYFGNDNQGSNDNFAVRWAGPGFEPIHLAAGNLSH